MCLITERWNSYLSAYTNSPNKKYWQNTKISYEKKQPICIEFSLVTQSSSAQYCYCFFIFHIYFIGLSYVNWYCFATLESWRQFCKLKGNMRVLCIASGKNIKTSDQKSGEFILLGNNNTVSTDKRSYNIMKILTIVSKEYEKKLKKLLFVIEIV